MFNRNNNLISLSKNCKEEYKQYEFLKSMNETIQWYFCKYFKHRLQSKENNYFVNLKSTCKFLNSKKITYKNKFKDINVLLNAGNDYELKQLVKYFFGDNINFENRLLRDPTLLFNQLINNNYLLLNNSSNKINANTDNGINITYTHETNVSSDYEIYTIPTFEKFLGK